MKYIDADRIRAEIERRFWDYGTPLHDDEVTTKVNEVLSIIDSLQQEQDIKSELKEEKIESSPVIKEFISKFFEIGHAYNFGFGPKDFLQEQPESSNGKFVFPNFLYARTVDNKTIDVSYAPQSLDAVEYIKNDPTEQPEVDLEEEMTAYFKDWYVLETDQGYILKTQNGNAVVGDVKNVARHFFNLGLNARKV